MIIDGHVHIGRTEKSERFFSLDSYEELARHELIEGAVIMPNVSNRILPHNLNFYLLDSLEKYKTTFKFFPFLLIDPSSPEILNQIDMNKDKIFGLKYHPSIYRDTISASSLKLFIRKAGDLNLPILVHCGRDKKSHISFLIHVAKKYPTVKFIAAHLGGNASDLIEKAINTLSPLKLKNLYLDTSAVKLPWLVEMAVNRLGNEKIIFGSDEPYSDLRMSKYCIELSDIERKGLVLSKNILNLIGVKYDENN